MPIAEVKLHNPIKVGITYSLNFEILEALAAANVDMTRYFDGLIPVWQQSTIVAWHRYHNLYRSHIEDARADHAKRQAKRK